MRSELMLIRTDFDELDEESLTIIPLDHLPVGLMVDLKNKRYIMQAAANGCCVDHFSLPRVRRRETEGQRLLLKFATRIVELA